jgi:hypothetical protein
MITLFGAVFIGIDAKMDWLFGSKVLTLKVFKFEPIQMHL